VPADCRLGQQSLLIAVEASRYSTTRLLIAVRPTVPADCRLGQQSLLIAVEASRYSTTRLLIAV